MRATIENTMVLIPARAGSKGVPQKNSKPFALGKSLTLRAVDLALQVFKSTQVVISTNDLDLLKQTLSYEIHQIQRAEHLASDQAGMLEVMLDAVDQQNWKPDFLLLLQPTSPFRSVDHINRAFELFQPGDHAVVAVNEPNGHPFYSLFQEENGYIHKFQKNAVVRRQDLPPMYDVNGLLYLFDISMLRQKSWVEFERIRPLIVPAWQAIDIDTKEDWWLAETLHAGIQVTGTSDFSE
jgi:N-acylneuraminate cytidylyltransferase